MAERLYIMCVRRGGLSGSDLFSRSMRTSAICPNTRSRSMARSICSAMEHAVEHGHGRVRNADGNLVGELRSDGLVGGPNGGHHRAAADHSHLGQRRGHRVQTLLLENQAHEHAHELGALLKGVPRRQQQRAQALPGRLTEIVQSVRVGREPLGAALHSPSSTPPWSRVPSKIEVGGRPVSRHSAGPTVIPL